MFPPRIGGHRGGQGGRGCLTLPWQNFWKHFSKNRPVFRKTDQGGDNLVCFWKVTFEKLASLKWRFEKPILSKIFRKICLICFWIFVILQGKFRIFPKKPLDTLVFSPFFNKSLKKSAHPKGRGGRIMDIFREKNSWPARLFSLFHCFTIFHYCVFLPEFREI